MYIPHYINAALPKTMSRTQQVRHTVKSFRIFSLLTTIAAVMCDWTQLNYYTQLSLNDTFGGGVSVSIIVVLGLDVSMFFLGTVLNQYRKATGTTKGNFRFIGIGLLVTFLIAYVVYLLMAIPVLSQQASDGDVPFYGRLLIPIASSALAFFTSVGWDPKGEQIQRLLDEKLKISSDIASVKNTIDKVNRDFAQLDIMEFENVEADRVYNLLMSKVNEATNEARIYLAEELGTSEAANALLAQAGLSDSFWSTARQKISTTSKALFPAWDPAADGNLNPVKEVPEASPTADSNSMPGISLDLTA